MPENDKLYKLIQWHLDFHTQVHIQDVYKMLYQGIFGAEHLLSDVERAKAYLEEEWNRVPTDKTINLLEPVSMDGKVVRANIQRCKAEGVELSQFWQAFYRSVSQIRANKNDFEKTWNDFIELCRFDALPFDIKSATQFGNDVKRNQWPAKHHTAEYREANYPAYRVLLKSEFENIIHTKLDAMDKFQ